MSDIVVRLRHIAIEDRQIILPESNEVVSRPYLGLEQIEAHTGRIIEYETSGVEGKSTTFAFDTSHVLYGKLRPYLNKVAVPERSGRCSTEIIPLLPQGVDREFLAFLLRTEPVVSAAMSEKTGSRMPRADMDVLLDTEVTIPDSESRRRKIVTQLKAQLAAVEEARQGAQILVKEVEHLRRCFRSQVMVELETASRVPLSNLLLGIEAGKSIQTSERLATENELAVLKVSSVSWGEFRPHEAKAVGPRYMPHERHRVRRDDLLISRANTLELVGAAVRVDRDYPNRLLSDKTLRLLLDETKICPDYLVQILRMPEARAHIQRNATGTSDSMRNISQGTLRATPIPLPALAIQEKIAKRMQKTDTLINEIRVAVTNQLADIGLLPSRLLAQVFEDPDHATS